MRGFVLGILTTVVSLVVIVIAVTHLGLYPIGADNPPGHLERTLAGRAMDVYAEKHKPAGDNPIQPTAATGNGRSMAGRSRARPTVVR